MSKQLGVLCHITSLVSEYGIGDFGKSSRNFIDFLKENNINIWQILPLNETNDYNCPYSSLCYFTYDPMFVDVDQLVSLGLINNDELNSLRQLSETSSVEYHKIKTEKQKLLSLAFKNIDQNTMSLLENYANTNPLILRYAVFKTLLHHFNTSNWRDLDPCYRNVNSNAYRIFVKENKHNIFEQIYIQYVLEQQWSSVMDYARDKGVTILGDIPIYPDQNSFDVFDSPQSFLLDKRTMLPLVYGGVPADDFCKDGQNWHTCVYDWEILKHSNYEYMINKIKLMLNRYDLLRLDHFLGYVEHYEISTTNTDSGNWVLAGGNDFFDTLASQIDINRLTVEDLGIMKQSANNVREQYNLTGMCVLQLAIGQQLNSNYLPNSVPTNCIYYTGTHDNNTLIGYINSLDRNTLEHFMSILDINSDTTQEIAIECMKKMINSKSHTIIFPIQDLLLQDEHYRMNIPGKSLGCWEYKLPHYYQNTVKQTMTRLKQS